ncbi:MAG: hypothetical protein DRJ03_08275 [Chloroflexi bacterium]|nr:MAG: hypothetical protein DRI81_02960 [Chloroflexota bacterium]RLC86626.1 MAG: hypothetical protein DRJ03_08275 [Chloroflexota bacterium]
MEHLRNEFFQDDEYLDEFEDFVGTVTWSDRNPFNTEMFFLWSMIRSTKPKLFVESGTFKGYSANLICEALERNGNGAEFITIGFNFQNCLPFAGLLDFVGRIFVLRHICAFREPNIQIWGCHLLEIAATPRNPREPPLQGGDLRDTVLRESSKVTRGKSSKFGLERRDQRRFSLTAQKDKTCLLYSSPFWQGSPIHCLFQSMTVRRKVGVETDGILNGSLDENIPSCIAIPSLKTSLHIWTFH